MSVYESTFWLSMLLIFYTYAIYPAILLVAASVRNANKQRAERMPGVNDTISLLVAVYNESDILVKKIQNLRDISADSNDLEILIGSDGSTDGTNELLQSCALPNLKVELFPNRRGKAAVLNDLFAIASGKIIVLSDANTFFDRNTVQKLVCHFQDSTVGAVTGELRLESDHTSLSGLGEVSYWTYENMIKRRESDILTTLGATGAVYAMRRELFTPLPTEKVVMDDFLIALNIIKQGYRVRYEPGALAYERSTGTVEGEFKRKVRIGAANFHGMTEFFQLLHPRHGFVAFALWSHKIIRWCVPFFLIAMFSCSVLLNEQSLFFHRVVMVELVFAGAAVGGFLCEKFRLPIGILSFPYYFLAMNAALFVGFIKFLLGRQRPTWDIVRS